MNKYLVTVTVTATGAKYGYVVFGSSMADADNKFEAAFSGLTDPALYSRTVVTQL